MKLAFVVYLLFMLCLGSTCLNAKYATAVVDLCAPTTHSPSLHLFLWEHLSWNMRGIQERISRIKCHNTILMSTGYIFPSISRCIYTALYDLVHCVKLCRPLDVALTLRDIGKSEYLGEILLSATLWARTQEEKDQVSYVTPTPHRSLQSAASIT